MDVVAELGNYGGSNDRSCVTVEADDETQRQQRLLLHRERSLPLLAEPPFCLLPTAVAKGLRCHLANNFPTDNGQLIALSVAQTGTYWDPATLKKHIGGNNYRQQLGIAAERGSRRMDWAHGQHRM